MEDPVKRKFYEYYQSLGQTGLIKPPSSIRNREFAFLTFGEALMLRHKAFDTERHLCSFLADTTPSDAYFSSAYFRNPTARMDKKGWLGADLVFDIDADHIITPCRKSHDIDWICEACLQSAKEETMKLLDMLLGDLGFPESEVKVFFSGHRGYHVHVESEKVRRLNSLARKEIADYVIGLGLKPELQTLFEENQFGFGVKPLGWSARIAEGVETLLAREEPSEIERLDLNGKAMKSLAENKARYLESLKQRGCIAFKAGAKREAENWYKIIQRIVALTSATIDTVVTTDVHRLIRLPRTLHRKTGFMKVATTPNRLPDFDPLKEAVAFTRGQLTVNLSRTPAFRVGDNSYGPFQPGERKKLPTAAALFLLCKGAAQVAD